MTQDILDGIRIVEVATWVFVPSASAILADWGADVVKIEHPTLGDPQRGLVSSSAGGSSDAGFNALLEQANRGKRSIGLDVATEGGRELLYKLVARSDVFMTNFLPDARTRLHIDVEDLRAINPDVIYARGTGFGVRGPEASQPAFDGAAYWARGGIAAAVTPEDMDWPVWARPGFGDSMGGVALASGILAALFRRECQGVSSIVDASLLGTAMWQLFPDVLNAPFDAGDYENGNVPRYAPRESFPNPLTNFYKTGDGRALFLVMMDS